MSQADALYTKLEPYANKFETLAKNHESAYLKLSTRLNSKVKEDPESLREVFIICKQVGDIAKLIQKDCATKAQIIRTQLPKLIFSSKQINEEVSL